MSKESVQKARELCAKAWKMKGTWAHFLPDNKAVHCIYSRVVPCVEDQVREWLTTNLPKGVRVEFQPDPRGHSLHVYYGTGETEYVSFG